MSQTPAPPPALGWKKTLLYSLLPVAILLAGLEIAGRIVEIWIPPRPADAGQGFSEESRLFVPSESDPARMITNPSKASSFQKQQFPRKKAPNTLRIFILGGSSVNYLDYELPFLAERLQQKLPQFDHIEIINCGGLSYGSHRLVLIAGEVLDYDADLLMIYSGHNEFEELEQLKMANLRSVPLQRLLWKSAFCRVVRDRIAEYQIAHLKAARNRRMLAESVPDTSRTWNRIFTETEISGRMAQYRDNLAYILRIAKEKGVPVILGTVPSNLFKPNLPGEAGQRYQQALDLFAKGDYEAGRTLAQEILQNASRHQSSDAENTIIRNLAQESGAPLADVEAMVSAVEPHRIPGETLFNDHCHLNPEGNKILIAAYEQQILKLFQGKTAS